MIKRRRRPRRRRVVRIRHRRRHFGNQRSPAGQRGVGNAVLVISETARAQAIHRNLVFENQRGLALRGAPDPDLIDLRVAGKYAIQLRQLQILW